MLRLRVSLAPRSSRFGVAYRDRLLVALVAPSNILRSSPTSHDDGTSMGATPSRSRMNARPLCCVCLIDRAAQRSVPSPARSRRGSSCLSENCERRMSFHPHHRAMSVLPHPPLASRDTLQRAGHSESLSKPLAGPVPATRPKTSQEMRFARDCSHHGCEPPFLCMNGGGRVTAATGL
jgi:hypothetical protein